MELGKRMSHSYGAFTELVHFLGTREFLLLQGLNRHLYELGIGRVQVRISTLSVFLMQANGGS